jgi:Phage tail tube protein
MPFSQNSRAGLSFVPEVTFGVTPGSPTLVSLPINTHSLDLSKERVTGNEIQPDRMLRVDRHGNRSVSGDIVVDLRKGDFDAFFESCLMSAFADSATLATLTATSSAGTATITFAAQTVPPYPVGSAITVAGITPAGFNGTWTVTACTTTSVSFLNGTAGPQTVAGTIKNRALKVGITPKSFSIEDAALDIAQFRLFTGMTVDTAAVSIKPNSMIATTFSLVGKDMTMSGTSVDPTKDPSSINQPFDSYSGTLSIGNAGAAMTAVALITGIDFSISNSLAPTFVVGSSSTPQIEFGMCSVEGTITAYFEDATLINRFINETTSAFQVTVNDPSGASNYTFHFPRVKINGASVPVDGPTGSRVISLPFVALYDTAENTNIEIIRNPS